MLNHSQNGVDFMKVMKKLAALLLAGALAATAALPAMASDKTDTTVSTAANKGSGAYTITMKSAEDNHTFKAYRIFDGSVATDGKLGDISWATGVNTTGIETELAAAGLATTVDGKTVDLSKAPDVAKALAKQSDDSATMIKVADVFFDRKGTVVATVSAKADGSDNYVLGSGAADSGNAPLVAGYYLVTDEYTTTPADAGAETLSRNILAVVGDVSAVVKNDKPEVEKKILEGTTKVDANKAGIGDTVAYEISTIVPNYVGYDNYFFVINDTLSAGLTFDGVQNLIVKNGTTVLSSTNDYTVYTGDEADGNTFQIAFKDIKSLTVGSAITVTYTATVNEKANIGTPGNPNTTNLIYSNNPNNSHGGTPSDNPKPDKDIPVGRSADDKTVTYVAELDLTKYKDAVGAGNLLAGATFTLTGTANVVKGTGSDIFEENASGAYWKLADDTYTTTAPHGDIKDANGNVKVQSNESSYASTTVKYALKHVTTYAIGTEEVFMQGTSGDDGKIVFKGLGAGTYTLTEVVTPTGYNTADPITFTIEIDVPSEIKDGTEAATFSVKDNTPANTVSISADQEGKFTTGLYLTNVIDNSGSTLPSTGGMGTTLFYVIGGLLIVAAAIVIISKRRVQEG
jgi:fimbrial isopeptide formation D2 family protein/LPXTG-motif cell wall-anchored protein